jgi:predicted adenine nucleotide alpha hydrolase (AANH) superfamily ATPase
MRFEMTAKYAHENNFDIISSTLGISRWKDMEQINDCGENEVVLNLICLIGILIGVKKAVLAEC